MRTRAFGPACRRLAVAMRAAATGARRREGGVAGRPHHFLLLCLCLASSLSVVRGLGWRGSRLAAVCEPLIAR